MTAECEHLSVRCLNHYELIRKYECRRCGAVMMCKCDEKIGRRFRAHQLGHTTDSDTGRRIAIKAEFRRGVCEECRGLTPEPHPKAEIHGNTTKIKRYYWRELAFREMELFGEWADRHGVSIDDKGEEAKSARESAKRQALVDIKRRHAESPKYTFREESQSDVIRACAVTVVLRFPERATSAGLDFFGAENNSSPWQSPSAAKRSSCRRPRSATCHVAARRAGTRRANTSTNSGYARVIEVRGSNSVGTHVHLGESALGVQDELMTNDEQK